MHELLNWSDITGANGMCIPSEGNHQSYVFGSKFKAMIPAVRRIHLLCILELIH